MVIFVTCTATAAAIIDNIVIYFKKHRERFQVEKKYKQKNDDKNKSGSVGFAWCGNCLYEIGEIIQGSNGGK